VRDKMENGKSLAERTSEALIRYITGNRLAAGKKLPNEFELSKRLGVGRSTIREAVRTLASRHILEVRQGAGTFVADKSLGIAADPLGFTFIPDKQKLTLDLLDIRLAIEPPMAARAAVEATAKEAAELVALADEVEKLVLAGRDHREKDTELHVKIAQCSRNLVIPNLFPIIQQAIAYYITSTNDALREETIKTHRQIVEAIKTHDPLRAMDAMTLHILYFRDMLSTLTLENSRNKDGNSKIVR